MKIHVIEESVSFSKDGKKHSVNDFMDENQFEILYDKQTLDNLKEHGQFCDAIGQNRYLFAYLKEYYINQIAQSKSMLKHLNKEEASKTNNSIHKMEDKLKQFDE